MSQALLNRIAALEAKVERVAQVADELEALRAELRAATEGIESRIDLRAKGLSTRNRNELRRVEKLAEEVLEWRDLLARGARNWALGITEETDG